MDSKLSAQHGHQHHNGVSKPPAHHGGGRRGGRQQAGGGGGGGGKGIKVVYISSPMQLTASAEEFRAVVQELTGRDSNVADHDLAGAPHAGAPSSSSTSSSSSSYASFGHASFPMTMAGAAAGARNLTPTMATAAGYYPAGVAGVTPPPAFQGMCDQTGSLIYGQDYW